MFVRVCVDADVSSSWVFVFVLTLMSVAVGCVRVCVDADVGSSWVCLCLC